MQNPNTARLVATSALTACGAGIPRGFETSVSSIRPGATARPTTATPNDRADNHAMGRHRRDGWRPSGTSSSKKVAAGPIPAIQTHVVIQAVNVVKAAGP